MTRRSLTDYQAAGFGGLSFATNLNFMNLPMSYEQRLWALEGLYCCAVAKIEADEKYKDDHDIGMLIAGTRLLLNQAGTDYRADYEAHTFGNPENRFRALVCQIFEKITQIQGRTRMIEREIVTQDVFA